MYVLRTCTTKQFIPCVSKKCPRTVIHFLCVCVGWPICAEHVFLRRRRKLNLLRSISLPQIRDKECTYRGRSRHGLRQREAHHEGRRKWRKQIHKQTTTTCARCSPSSFLLSQKLSHVLSLSKVQHARPEHSSFNAPNITQRENEFLLPESCVPNSQAPPPPLAGVGREAFFASIQVLSTMISAKFECQNKQSA